MKKREGVIKMKEKLLAFLLTAVLAISAVPVWATDEDEDNEDAASAVIEYKTENDYTVTFRATDFENCCLEETGENLTYVNFELPATSAGSLWYDYEGEDEEKVKSTTKYYRNSSSSSARLIGNVTFVPKSTYTGTVEIAYNGYTADRKVNFTGTVKITVTEGVNKGDLDKLTYDIAPGQKLKLSSSDFNKVCRNAGFMLSYVKFELPSSSIGTYYYDYRSADTYNTLVSENAKYYKSSSDDEDYTIDNVTLVTNKNADGNVELTYYAYDSAREEYEGVIRLRFDSDSANTTYETNGEVVFINASDINRECINQTGSKVSYVKFSYPSKGTLYYDYDDEDGDRGTVRSSTKYYYSKSPYIYLVGYVPPADYSGTVIIDYEAYNIDGDSCNGSLSVKVDTEDIEEADDITYSVKNNSYVTFAASDFNSECKSVTGEKLDYVRFSDVSSGTLYYKYDSSEDDNDKITSGGRYYYSDGDSYIKNVSYVPRSSYTGTVTVKYTGYSVEGTSYTGNVKITVKSSSSSSSSSSSDDDEADDIKYSGEVGEKISFKGSDFNSECKSLFSVKLEYVRFKLPSSSSGTLYYGDGKTLKSTYECYYNDDDIDISDVYFVPKKSGKITITYAGVSIDEDEFSGSVVITAKAVSSNDDDDDDNKDEVTTGMNNFKYVTSYKSSLFTDIDESAWYGSEQTGAIKSAYRYGFVQGRGDKIFDPSGNITVAEAVTIAARIADIYYGENTKFTTTGKTNWYDDYVDYAVKKKIIGKSDFVNYNKNATRAEMAYIFAHVLPSSEYDKKNSITSIPDVKSGLKYYDEIMLLYNAGILSGNDDKGTFAPSTNITRAEVSAIVVRIANKDERRTNKF